MNKGDKLPNEEILLRRVFSSDKRYIDPSGRPTSRAFTPRPKDEGKLSVNAKTLTTYAATITDPSKYKVFWVSVDFANSLELSCIYDPLTVENDGIDNIAHSYIEGIPEEDEAIAGLLARKSEEQAPF